MGHAVTRTLSMALLGAALLSCSASAELQQPLNEGWRFRAVDSADHPEAKQWHPATVPGVIQTDLRRANIIPDFFFGDNEKRLQWIGLTDWEYSTDFDISAAAMKHQHMELVFEGLDTFATGTLNGKPLLHADNMFRTWRVDAKPSIQPGRNTLRIVFESPFKLLNPIVAKLPYIIPGTGYEPLDPDHGIYPISQYVRQAPYQYGWDWGPRFITAGIWRPVHLDLWDDVRIAAFHLHQDSVTAVRAILEANLSVQASHSAAATLELRVTTPEGVRLPVHHQLVQLDPGSNHLLVPLRIDHPRRWYPNGYGPQSRYTVVVTLASSGKVLGRSVLRTGLRSVELQRKPDPWGTSFTFVINGIPVFAKGANFVPLDSFPPSTTIGKKREILTAARDVHMNMLRMWGGGFYETDDFYDLADELGLMIWHDFAFGGAMVPGDKAFQENVRAEAAEQVERLSDHPSMVLWCGNNEVETAWHNWGDHLKFKDALTTDQRERVWQDYVVMFRDILKSTVAIYGNGVPYWTSSPGSDFADVPPGQQDGDEHSWKVWSAGAPIAEYVTESPRFLSEFGFQAMPDLRTVRAFAGTEEDLASPALLNHERFSHGYERMNQYLSSEFRPARDFSSFIYLSQLMQAEAIKLGVEHMRSMRPKTMGTLYWRLDDCWPVASWSSIDYYGRWKALHYYARRFYAPLLIATEATAGAADSTGYTLAIHLVSDEPASLSATLHVRLMHFDGTVMQDEMRPLSVAALASTPVTPIALHSFDPTTTFAVLTLETPGHILATNTFYFAPSRNLQLPPVSVAHTFHKEATGYALELRSSALARATAVNFGDLDAKADDNYFDLLPNQPRTIHIATKVSQSELESGLEIRSLIDAVRSK